MTKGLPDLGHAAQSTVYCSIALHFRQQIFIVKLEVLVHRNTLAFAPGGLG